MCRFHRCRRFLGACRSSGAASIFPVCGGRITPAATVSWLYACSRAEYVWTMLLPLRQYWPCAPVDTLNAGELGTHAPGDTAIAIDGTFAAMESVSYLAGFDNLGGAHAERADDKDERRETFVLCEALLVAVVNLLHDDRQFQ